VNTIRSSDKGTKLSQAVVKSVAFPNKSQAASLGFQTVTVPEAAKGETASTKTS